MVSVAARGRAERILTRSFCSVVWAGSGTPAIYSSIFLGAALGMAAELRLPTFDFFMRGRLREG